GCTYGRLFTHRSVDADAAGADEKDREKGGEIEPGLFVQCPVHHRYVAVVGPEFGYAHAETGYERGKTGEETQYEQQAAEQFREDDQDEGDAVAYMEGVGEHILQVCEILQFVQTVINTKYQTEGKAQRQDRYVEGAFGILGGK